MKSVKAIMGLLVILPCLAFAQGNNGSQVITIDKKLWDNWEGRAELKQLGIDVLGACGPQKLSAENISQAQAGVQCFEREIGKYFPSFQTSKVPVKTNDGSVQIATVVDGQTAEAEKKIPNNAMMLLAHEAPLCGNFARLTAEQDRKGQATRALIAQAMGGKQTTDTSPAVIRGFNCYVNLLTSFSNY